MSSKIEAWHLQIEHTVHNAVCKDDAVIPPEKPNYCKKNRSGNDLIEQKYQNVGELIDAIYAGWAAINDVISFGKEKHTIPWATLSKRQLRETKERFAICSRGHDDLLWWKTRKRKKDALPPTKAKCFHFDMSTALQLYQLSTFNIFICDVRDHCEKFEFGRISNYSVAFIVATVQHTKSESCDFSLLLLLLLGWFGSLTVECVWVNARACAFYPP